MRFSTPRITTTLIIAAAAILLREIAVQLAADWIEKHLSFVGDFIAWRWSSVVIGFLAAGIVLAVWDLVASRRTVRSEVETGPLSSQNDEIVILVPNDGAKVLRTFKIRGFAKTFEGNLVVEDLMPDGTWSPLIVTTVGMLEGHSQFSVNVTLAPGHHTLRVGSATGRGDWFGVKFSVNVESRPRILGQGMMHVETWGLDRDGSYHRVPVDVVELLRTASKGDSERRKLPMGTANTKHMLGREVGSVEEEAERLGLVEKYLDPTEGWFVVMTDKGVAFLAAYEDWLKQLVAPPPAAQEGSHA